MASMHRTDHHAPRRQRLLLTAAALAAWSAGAPIAAAETEPAVAEPAKAAAVTPRKTDPKQWSWGQPVADVSPTGDLVWKPQPFAFKPGKQVSYINYDKGSDDAAGTKEAPWKHHPWDAAATGKAKAASGARTYVFKRGVTYRGALLARESGTEAEPIRLTSDPSWGKGEAVIAGSERVTGWKQGSQHADVPEAGKVWWVDLDFLPRNVWEVQGDKATRIELARLPNWKVSDPEEVKSEWWSWEQPEWWTNKHKIDFNGHRAHRGIDTKHLDGPAEKYVGAIVRTEYAIVMGTPFPTEVEGYDAQHKALIFQGIWWGDSEQLTTNCRYYLEDKPHYLDAGGEFWFERKGEGGRLHLRLPGDRDPNAAQIEVARRINLIQDVAADRAPDRLDITPAEAKAKLPTDGVSNLEISGLSFRFTNTLWQLQHPGWMHKDVNNAAVRLLGASDGIRIANCSFAHVAKAARIEPLLPSVRIGRVAVTDNDISFTDHGAIILGFAGGQGDAVVARNRMFEVGFRPYRQTHGHALEVNFPATMDVAGNWMHRCHGAGIFVYGGKNGGDTSDVAMSRHLIRSNRVVDSLLTANDWGGIETWQGGPFYVYNNISGNPNGRWWAYDPNKANSARLGFAFYHDGGFQNYDFNNVAWGNTTDGKSKLMNHAAFYEAVPTIENSIFNNTVYRFFIGTQWSPGGGRHFFLGNLWIDVPGMAFQHGQLKEDKGEKPAHYPHHNVAYGKNVFAGVQPETFGVFESIGKGHDLASMAKALEGHGALAADVGIITDKPVVRDAEKHDFRPVPGSPAIDRGVKAFVPWGLAKTVGEWHFRRNGKDPSVVQDNHWHMAPYYVDRHHYHAAPLFDLKATAATEKSYVDGPLEDWCAGAFALDGKTHLVAEHAGMVREVAYQVGNEQRKASGKQIVSPDIDTGNLLIEAYLQAKPGVGTIAGKLSDAGYRLAINKAGGVTLTLTAAGQTVSLAAGGIVTDGKWHHVLAEVDRAAGTGTIYVDGVKNASGPLSLPKDASLSNGADLVVGKGVTGAIEFLRIARGTLADAKTTIEELYDWQFDGPFLRDFAGNPISGKARDAGAFESTGK